MKSEAALDPKSLENAAPAVKGYVLLVDDQELILQAYSRLLKRVGFEVFPVSDSSLVPSLLGKHKFDLVLCDIAMPRFDGIQVLQAVHAHDPDLPVVLITGGAALDSAIKAIEYGALRYLIKPVPPADLRKVVEEGVRRSKLARLQKQAFELYGFAAQAAEDRDAREAQLRQALTTLWMAYQPIVRFGKRAVVAYEALVRSDDPVIRRPDQLFDAAEAIGMIADVGRVIRARVAGDIPAMPTDADIYVNLHPQDLNDPDLYEVGAPLSKVAGRVTLEITERASLAEVPDVRAKLGKLRELGFRIAVDDLGAGYAGLSALAEIAPDVVKLDMALVRDLDHDATKHKLVSSMIGLCHELDMHVVAEGVETSAERDALVALGCDLLQGYWFGRPERRAAPVDPRRFEGEP